MILSYLNDKLIKWSHNQVKLSPYMGRKQAYPFRKSPQKNGRKHN